MDNKLQIKMLKNNNVIFTKSDVPFFIKDTLKEFILDDIITSVEIKNDELILRRENNEFLFTLNISSLKNNCNYFLKETNSSFLIDVDYADYKLEDNKLLINYQIETDDFLTTLEINFK